MASDPPKVLLQQLPFPHALGHARNHRLKCDCSSLHHLRSRQILFFQTIPFRSQARPGLSTASTASPGSGLFRLLVAGSFGAGGCFLLLAGDFLSRAASYFWISRISLGVRLSHSESSELSFSSGWAGLAGLSSSSDSTLCLTRASWILYSFFSFLSRSSWAW